MTELGSEQGCYWGEYERIIDPRSGFEWRRARDQMERHPEAERGLSPREAIGEFSSCTAMLAGVMSRAGEIAGLVSLLSQISKLRSLSPAVSIAADVVEFSANARRGWIATELRHSVFERVSAPVPDLNETTRLGIRLLTIFYQGLESAVMGARAAFDWAEMLEANLPYVALAWQVRTVAHLSRAREASGSIGRSGTSR
jgi:hypothetical protein